MGFPLRNGLYSHKRRREIAKTASTFGKNAANISEEELDTAERNERRALDQTNRRVGDALEATGWKDGEESTLTRDSKVKRISVGGEEPGQGLENDSGPKIGL